MNSYNLLLCVVDYIYHAISISRLKNHLNADFDKSKTPLEVLCEKFEGASLDTKHLTLEQLYERKMSARSEVDERIFLKPLLTFGDIIFSDKFEEEAISVLSGDLCQYINNDFLIKFSSQNCLAKLNAPEKIQPPAEGKSYMITPDDTVCQNSAFYSDMKLIERMDELLSIFRSQGKSFNFDFVDCQGNPREYIAEQALAMGLEMNVDLTAILQSSEFLVSIYICAAVLFCILLILMTTKCTKMYK
uniref:Uncharacterized protein n=1 Tax=Meloidogyne javanica TaxID=6303 RepID=A0A915LZT3_MELJA